MTCDNIPLDRSNYSDISGLCWIDKETLVVAQHKNKQLLKVKVNMDTKSCGIEVIDSDMEAWQLSCTKEGRIYVSDFSGANRKLYIYELKTGDKRIWETQENINILSIGSNENYVVLNQYYESYVYAKNKTFLFKILHAKLLGQTTDLYITNNDILWGATTESLVMSNLKTKESKVIYVNDGVENGWHLSGTSDGHVFVTDFLNQKVGVYLEDGTFLHFLEFDPPEGGSRSLSINDIIELQSGKAILAFEKNTGAIKFYSLDLGA